MCWTRSHIGMPGNETAFKVANHALDLPITEIAIHCKNYKLHIKNHVGRLWQIEWDE